MSGHKLTPVKVGGMVWRSRNAFCIAIGRNPSKIYYDARKFPDTDFNVLAAALWEDYKRGNPTPSTELFEKATGRKATGRKALEQIEVTDRKKIAKGGANAPRPVTAGGRTWPNLNQFCKAAHSAPISVKQYEREYPDKTLDAIAQAVWDARDVRARYRRATIRRILDGERQVEEEILSAVDKAEKRAAYSAECDAIVEQTPEVILKATRIFRKMVIRGGHTGEIILKWPPKETGEGRVTFYGGRWLKWTIDLNKRVLECSYLDGEPRIWPIPDDDEEVDEDDEP